MHCCATDQRWVPPWIRQWRLHTVQAAQPTWPRCPIAFARLPTCVPLLSAPPVLSLPAVYRPTEDRPTKNTGGPNKASTTAKEITQIGLDT